MSTYTCRTLVATLDPELAKRFKRSFTHFKGEIKYGIRQETFEIDEDVIDLGVLFGFKEHCVGQEGYTPLSQQERGKLCSLIGYGSPYDEDVTLRVIDGHIRETDDLLEVWLEHIDATDLLEELSKNYPNKELVVAVYYYSEVAFESSEYFFTIMDGNVEMFGEKHYADGKEVEEL